MRDWISDYVGLMDSSFCSLLLFTNSLFIKSPRGCCRLLPLGAVSSTSIVRCEWGGGGKEILDFRKSEPGVG